MVMKGMGMRWKRQVAFTGQIKTANVMLMLCLAERVNTKFLFYALVVFLKILV
jgi:hypothetical protein